MLWEPPTGKMPISRNVQFNEKVVYRCLQDKVEKKINNNKINKSTNANTSRRKVEISGDDNTRINDENIFNDVQTPQKVNHDESQNNNVD